MASAPIIAGRPNTLRGRITRSPFGRAATLPHRLRSVGSYNAQIFAQSVAWLRRSREYTNYTYELAELNRRYLAWFVAVATQTDVGRIEEYFNELTGDSELHGQLLKSRLMSGQWRTSDPVQWYGRRLGWYALVRALKPQHVVETGTDKGLGSMVFASALLRNGSGRLTTIDVNPSAGYLIGGRWSTVIDYCRGDSLAVLPKLDSVDFFLHDSLHTLGHERAELALVDAVLSADAAVVSDAARDSCALVDWAEQRGRQFAYFQERPRDHWYPGEGIGLSLKSRGGRVNDDL